MTCKSPRGTKDLYQEDYMKFRQVHDFLYEIATQEGFEGLETPIFELEGVFVKNLGDTSDIVKDEIYKIQKKGKEELVLRPEFTAGVVRAYMSNSLYLKKAASLFSFGPLFRYDRPQAGRYRQFWQANFEKIGFSDSISDFEMIYLGWRILSKYLSNFVLYINHLGGKDVIARYKKVIAEYFFEHKDKLSIASQQRIFDNPLRILDSKLEQDFPVVQEAPKISELYSDEVRSSFNRVLDELKNRNIKYVVDNSLVRGLDYYTGIIFEFKDANSVNAQSTILGGGRYDYLISNMSDGKVNNTAIGMAMGIERLILSAEDGIKLTHMQKIGVVSYVQDDRKILDILNTLKSREYNSFAVFAAPMHLGVDKQFKYLVEYSVKKTLMIYDNELWIKCLNTGAREKIDDLHHWMKSYKV